MIYPLLFFYVFINIVFSTPIKTPITKINDVEYISINKFAKNHNMHITLYNEKNKFEVKYLGKKIIFSAYCSFIKIEDDIISIINPIIIYNKQFYIYKHSLIKLLNTTELPQGAEDISEQFIVTTAPSYNIHNINIENKLNGSILKINTTQKFNIETIAYSISKSGWLNVTILNGIIDSTNISKAVLVDPIKEIRCLQLPESAQLSFLLKSKIDDVEIIQNPIGNILEISLRTAINENSDRIKRSRKNWLLDTIVIDAGHGGKDKGAVSPSGLQEKTVCLDISKKLGKLIQRKMGIKVIYTREEDVFIPLWKRTKIANESGGKVFISIHANSSPHSKSAQGFETYLLRLGKTQDAIEVAKRENAVIAMEEAAHDYGDFSDEQIILATMAQHEFMKESEFLASVIQTELDKRLTTPNRGVKQAGFYVLVGGSMPNVLIECGFLSNSKEAKLLSKSSYRQKIAESIFDALVVFKDQYESSIIGTN